MSRTPTEEAHEVIWREVNLSAEIIKLWGAKWNQPEIAYRFSNERVFVLRTQDAGIYQQPDEES